MTAYIHLDSVSVEFPIYNVNARSIKKEFLRVATGGKVSSSNEQKTVLVSALDNLSLEIKQGDRIGLLGHNGAGKSTLLRLLSNIYEPTSGHMEIRGKVSSLLDVMLGIEQELTGYENITTRCILLGLSKAETKAKMAQIAKFTELGDFLSMPIRTYSAGMKLRLAFSVVTSIDPEILILDEVITAGDTQFMEKAKQRMDQLINKAHIVVMASHANNVIESLCNKVITLEAGRIKSITTT